MPDGKPVEQLEQLRNEKAVLEDLLKLREKTVSEQSGKLKQAVNELEARARALEFSENSLRDQTAILQSILNSMSDGVVVANKEWKFILFNPAAERIIGIGFTKTAPEEWPRKYGCYYPDAKTLFQHEELPLVRAMRGEDIDNMEMVIRNEKKKDGVWISINARPLRDAAGAVTGGIVVLRDISEEKIAKRALSRGEERLQSILDNATSVIYVKDLKGNYLLLNRQFEKLFKVDRHHVRAKNDYDLFPKEMADAFRANDIKVISAGEAVEFEEIALHEDGPHTYISIKFPLFDEHKVPYAVCGISTDITARKKAEEATRNSLAYLDSIINAVADPIFVKDRQYRCVLINDAYCHFIGHPREKLLNKSASDFFPKKQADIFHEKDEMVFKTGRENINEEEFTDAQGIVHTIVTKKTLYVDNQGGNTSWELSAM
jgi:PAS domain S-box-containing protein